MVCKCYRTMSVSNLAKFSLLKRWWCAVLWPLRAHVDSNCPTAYTVIDSANTLRLDLTSR